MTRPVPWDLPRLIMRMWVSALAVSAFAMVVQLLRTGEVDWQTSSLFVASVVVVFWKLGLVRF